MSPLEPQRIELLHVLLHVRVQSGEKTFWAFRRYDYWRLFQH